MSRCLGFVQVIKKTFPSRFLAATASKLPVVGSMIDHMLFEGDGLIYLPGDKPIKIDRPMAAQMEMVLSSQVVEHFIGQASYYWINRSASRRLQHPGHDQRGQNRHPAHGDFTAMCLQRWQARPETNSRFAGQHRMTLADQLRSHGQKGYLSTSDYDASHKQHTDARKEPWASI